MRLIKILLPLSIFVSVHSVVLAQSRNCFIIGSTHSLVRNLQGIPNSIYKSSETKETWYYGKSSITFNNHVVSEYDNYGRNLKICKEVISSVPSPEVKERAGYLQPERSKSKAGKASTEDWILEKLNKYTSQNIEKEGYYSTVSKTQYPGKNIKNTSYNIENGNLVVRMRVDEQRGAHDESYTIPIHDIKRIHADMGELIFTTRAENITYVAGREQRKESAFSIKFDFQTEADIKQRLVSAFSHLQKFYKGQKKKEVF
jgi:hypothetical protein